MNVLKQFSLLNHILTHRKQGKEDQANAWSHHYNKARVIKHHHQQGIFRSLRPSTVYWTAAFSRETWKPFEEAGKQWLTYQKTILIFSFHTQNHNQALLVLPWRLRTPRIKSIRTFNSLLSWAACKFQSLSPGAIWKEISNYTFQKL